jgi:CubicO group peptidase (beta-lactamase class C family)
MMITLLRILVCVTVGTALVRAQALGPVPAGNERPRKPATPVETIASALVAAQPVPPATPAGQTLALWLEMLNSSDTGRQKSFLEAQYPDRHENVDKVLAFCEQTGGLDLIKIESSAPFEISVIVKEREGGNYRRWTMKVEEQAPHRPLAMWLPVVPAPGGAASPPRLSVAEAVEAWKAEIQKQTQADRFAGAYLWARDGKVIVSGATGLADRETKTPNTLDAQFNLGSMNKMFTAVAALQLIEKGKLALEDPIIKHLPDYPNQDLASKVTVRHLLTHVGGTGDIFGPEYEQNRLSLRALADYVKLYGVRPLKFEPGARWEYSNYGFLLLGFLIEKVSGQSYYDYVRQNIFRPAGMTSTDSLPEDEKVPQRATGYMKAEAAWAPNTKTLPWRGTSAGGGYSTVGDLLRFAQALASHKILSAHWLAEATKEQGKAGSGYGYGFVTGNEGGVHFFGHSGGAPGINGVLRVYPESGTVVAVLSNLGPPGASYAAEWLCRQMPPPTR